MEKIKEKTYIFIENYKIYVIIYTIEKIKIRMEFFMGNYLFVDEDVKKSKVFLIYLSLLLISTLMVVATEYAFFGFNYNNTMNWLINNYMLLLISSIIIMSFITLMFGITRRYFLSIFIVFSVVVIFSIAMYLKMHYTNEPIIFADVMNFFSTKDGFSTLPIRQLAMSGLAVISLVVCIILILRNTKSINLNIYLIIYNIIISLYIIEGYFNYYNDIKISSTLGIVISLVIFCISCYKIVESNNALMNRKKKKFSFNVFIALVSMVICVFFVINYNNNIIAKAIASVSDYPQGSDSYIHYEEDCIITAFPMTNKQNN